MNTKWEDLSLANDFIFGKVMLNQKLCKQLLETILNIRIDRIEYPEEQKAIRMAADAKGVRLDVYVADGQNTVYNIEMQAGDTKELPKRSRYYQGMVDLNLIERGQHYKDLNKCFVIFVCTFDPFDKGRHIYTFENRCAEDLSLIMGDEATKVFLNSAGTMDDVGPELKTFLGYLANGVVADEFTKALDDEVGAVKNNEEWRREYMTLLMRDQQNVEIGEKKQLVSTVKRMLKMGRFSYDEIAEVAGTTKAEVKRIEEEEV